MTFPPVVLLSVVACAVAAAAPLELSSPLPLVAFAFAAPPVVVPFVVLFALAPDPDTLPMPVPVIGAVTVVFPTDALLLWLALSVIEVGPPAVAELPVDGATVCMIAPVFPRPSQSDSRKQLALELADVFVSAPFAVLRLLGLLVIEVSPVLFPLDADGLTVMSFPHQVSARNGWLFEHPTTPVPEADGFESVVALPPCVWLDVFEFDVALAAPLPLSSPAPELEVALAAPPVVVSVVVVVALAPDPLTEPFPVAVSGALTVVAPTVAELPWFVVALMFVAPLPAEAELVTVGVTFCVIAPVPDPPSPLVVAARVTASWLQVFPPLLPVCADVQVVAPLAVLFADGDSVMDVWPVLLLLDACGETVIELPLTVPVPVALGLLVTLAAPPVVWLVVDDVDCDVAPPLPPDPEVAVEAAGPPLVVPVVVDEADVPLPPPANAGDATRVSTSAVEKIAVTADERYDVNRFLNDVSPGLMPSLP